MTIKLDLPPELFAALQAKAERTGQPLTECASQMLQHALEEDTLATTAPRVDVEQRFREWGRKFSRLVQGRLDDSRESIYADRD